MAITKGRIIRKDIVDVITKPILTDSDNKTPGAVLDVVNNIMDNPKELMTKVMDKVKTLDDKIEVDINLADNPVAKAFGEAGKALGDLGGLVKDTLNGALNGFLDRLPGNDAASLFDNILCRPKKPFDINVNLILPNIFGDLNFGFDFKLCGESIKGNPIDAILNRVKEFDPRKLVSLNGNTLLDIKNKFNKFQNKGPTIPGLKNDFLNKVLGVAGEIGLISTRPGFTIPIKVPGLSNNSSGSSLDFVIGSGGGNRPSGGNGKRREVTYDWDAWLESMFLGSSFNSTASDRRHLNQVLKTYRESVGGSGLVYRGMGHSLKEGGNTYNKLLATSSFSQDNKDKATPRGMFNPLTDNIVKNLGKEETGTTEEFNNDTVGFLDNLLPNWNKDDNGNTDYSRTKGNEFFKARIENTAKAREPLAFGEVRDITDVAESVFSSIIGVSFS